MNIIISNTIFYIVNNNIRWVILEVRYNPLISRLENCFIKEDLEFFSFTTILNIRNSI